MSAFSGLRTMTIDLLCSTNCSLSNTRGRQPYVECGYFGINEAECRVQLQPKWCYHGKVRHHKSIKDQRSHTKTEWQHRASI